MKNDFRVENGVKHVKIVQRDGTTYEMLVDLEFDCKSSIWLGCTGGYASTRIDGKNELIHRLVVGAKKGQIVDHINRNKLDNRKENLRIVTRQQNIVNSVTKGITFNKLKEKYQARITTGNKRKSLGYYETEEEAMRAYQQAHLKVYGEFSPYYKQAN